MFCMHNFIESLLPAFTISVVWVLRRYIVSYTSRLIRENSNDIYVGNAAAYILIVR